MRNQGNLENNKNDVIQLLEDKVTPVEIARRYSVTKEAVYIFINRHTESINNKDIKYCKKDGCKNIVERRGAFYCSKQCGRTQSARNIKGVLYYDNKKCKLSKFNECNTTFSTTGDKKKFCSIECGDRYEYLKYKNIIESSGLTCEVCHTNLVIDLHHIIPVCKGGTNDASNVTILCPNHHTAIHRYKASLSEEGIYKLKDIEYKVRSIEEIGKPDWFEKYIKRQHRR